MTIAPCLLEHSVDVNASASFVWDWRTDVRAWDDPPARFSLDGPFATGSWGATIATAIEKGAAMANEGD
jgi:hypothetical protein